LEWGPLDRGWVGRALHRIGPILRRVVSGGIGKQLLTEKILWSN